MDVRGDDVGFLKSYTCSTLRAQDGYAKSGAFDHGCIIGSVPHGDDFFRAQSFDVIRLGFRLVLSGNLNCRQGQLLIDGFLIAVCVGSY